MTAYQTSHQDFAQTDDEAATLSEGDKIWGPVDSEYVVLNANPFEVFVENTLTKQRMALDTRDISDGPYRVI